MEKLVKKKKWILGVILVIGVFLSFRACTSQATKELVKSVSLHRVEDADFSPEYDAIAIVVAKNETRYPIEGMLVKYYVHLGDVVKKGDKLFMFSSMGKDIVIKSKSPGIVSELNEGFVAIADDNMQLQFDLPQQYLGSVSIGQTIQATNDTNMWQGEITEISGVIVNKNGVEYHGAYADISSQSTLKLGMEVDVKITMNTISDATMVPLAATIQVNGQIYVIKKSWLEHPLELLLDDYVIVKAIGTTESMLVLDGGQLQEVDICVFSGISSDFIKELVKGL